MDAKNNNNLAQAGIPRTFSVFFLAGPQPPQLHRMGSLTARPRRFHAFLYDNCGVNYKFSWFSNLSSFQPHPLMGPVFSTASAWVSTRNRLAAPCCLANERNLLLCAGVSACAKNWKRKSQRFSQRIVQFHKASWKKTGKSFQHVKLQCLKESVSDPFEWLRVATSDAALWQWHGPAAKCWQHYVHLSCDAKGEGCEIPKETREKIIELIKPFARLTCLTLSPEPILTVTTPPNANVANCKLE